MERAGESCRRREEEGDRRERSELKEAGRQMDGPEEEKRQGRADFLSFWTMVSSTFRGADTSS